MDRSTEPRRLARRRARVGALVGALAVVPLLAACDVTTDVPFDCAVLGRSVVPVRSDASPDSVAPGGALTNEIDIDLPEVSVEVPVDSVVVLLRLPDQLVEPSVTFAGGSLAGTAVEDGSDLRITFDAGGIPSTPLDLPTITVSGTVDPAALGGTMVWQTPRQVQLAVDFQGTPLTETCTAADIYTVINNTDIAGPRPSTTTTATTSTTTVPAPIGTTQHAVFESECAVLGTLAILSDASWSPVPVLPGSTVALTNELGLPAMASSFGTHHVEVRYPVPAGLTVEGVTFAPGTPATWSVMGDQLNVRYDTGGTPVNEITLPALTISARVTPDAGPTVELPPPSLTFSLDLGTPVEDACTSAQAPSIAAITVS